jgi:hypothetical protein
LQSGILVPELKPKVSILSACSSGALRSACDLSGFASLAARPTPPFAFFEGFKSRSRSLMSFLFFFFFCGN